MSADMRTYILQLLKTYRERERKIAILRYELANPAKVSDIEQIEAMSYAQGDGLGRTKGRISNKTLYIALNYKEQVNRVNAGVTNDIASRLVELENEQNRLVYYVSLLDKRSEDVLRLAFFEQHTWAETAQILGVALRTVHKIKDEAVDKLVEMYAFAGAVP